MAQGETLAVHGVTELMRGLKTADRATKAAVRADLRLVGESVRVDQVRQMSAIDSRSAAGYKTRVRQRGVVVEQSLRKTTGKHPEYGAMQMRLLLRALAANADKTRQAMEQAMDRIAARFNR